MRGQLLVGPAVPPQSYEFVFLSDCEAVSAPSALDTLARADRVQRARRDTEEIRDGGDTETRTSKRRRHLFVLRAQ